jgi:ubiquinone/menaquinone biosynthesis C-methylase UbiE
MPSETRAGADALWTSAWSDSAGKTARTDWSAYATAYDLLADYNPAYQDLLQDFCAFISTVETPRLIYDVGGGTGNYTEIAARACPGSEIRFVEPDLGMIGRAQSKLSALRNIAYDPSPFESIDAPGTADLVICVHALYAMPQPEQRLIDMARLLRPGGWLYLIDLGRYLDVTEWRSYLFRQLRTKYGLARALRVAWQAREIAKQNRAILEAQKSGAYWTHSDTEMAAHATAAGLTIYRQQTVYRGYSDLLVCRATGFAP